MKIAIKKKLSIFILFLLLTFTFMPPATAHAQGIIVNDAIKDGEVLDHNVLLSGQEASMDGVVNGDLLAIGDKVSINGEVNGSLIAIGKNVLINGPISGTTYVAALNLILGPLANIGRDMHFIGSNVKTQEGSAISRDLNTVSLGTDLSGTVGGDVNGVVGPENLVRGLYQFLLDQGWLPEPLKVKIPWSGSGYEPQAIPALAFSLQPVHSIIMRSSEPAIQPAISTETGLKSIQQAGAIDGARLQSWLTKPLRNLAALIILGLLVIWLLPAQLSYSAEQVRTKPWQALMTGVLVFVVGWFLAALALLLTLALAVFFYWISLPNLAFLLGTLGLSFLGIAISIFWLDIMFFSKIVVAYLCGRTFFNRFLPKYAHRKIWPMLTGVIVYVLLASIPYIGWLIMVIVTCLGLGAIWKLTAGWKQPEALAPEQAQPVAEISESVPS